MLFETGLFCLGRLVFGIRSGLLCLHLPSVLTTLLIGPTLLVSWLSGSPFWVVFTGLLVVWDLGVGGVSCVELLILHELWAGERLPLEKAHPRYLRLGRPISVSAVPFGPGIDIWRSCRFIILFVVILVGKSVAMVLLLDLVRVSLSFSCCSFWVSFVTL